MSNFLFKPLFSDSYTRANENPLAPANYGVTTDQNDPLQIVSNVCTGNTDLFGEMYLKNPAVYPNDQYAKVSIANIINDPIGSVEFFVGLRSTSAGQGTFVDHLHQGLFFVLLTDGVNLNHARWNLFDASCNTGDLAAHITPQSQNPIAISPGDIFQFAYIGQTFYAWQNGKLFITQSYTRPVAASAGLPTSGIPVIGLEDVAAITDVTFGSLETGSAQIITTSYDQWGVSNERIFLDSTGASQNSNAPFPLSNESNISAVDDPKTQVISVGLDGTILFKNPS